MAATAVCDSSRRRTLAYVKPKSRDNPGPCGANAGAVSRCCHSPLWGAAYACRRWSCPGSVLLRPRGLSPTASSCSLRAVATLLMLAHCRFATTPVRGETACTWTNFRSYAGLRLRPRISFRRTLSEASARFPREGRRRVGAFPLTLIYSFSMTGMANCHLRLSRALASVSKGPSVHSCTRPELRPGRVHVKLTILGLNNFDRNLEFEHNSASGSHPVPLQASSGCPNRPDQTSCFPQRWL